ncbi:MAG: glycosyltransferase family 39 protein [Solirubrobacteraceae bacterium]
MAIGLGVLVLAGAALRFYGLGHQGFWYDEANTVFLLNHPLGKMLGLLPGNESTPPLYYIVAWLWTRVFGVGEAGLRSLSALFGVLVIPVAYLLGRTLATRRVGLVLAALVAFNPLLIWYSQEARSYSLLVLLTALSLLALVRYRVTPRPRAAIGWALAAVLALTSHYYAVLAVAPQALWLLYEHRRRSAQIAVAVVAACGAALIPLALSQNGTHRDLWIARSPMGTRLNQILPQMLIGPGSPDRMLVKFVAIAAALIGLALLVLRTMAVERRTALVALGLLLGAAVVSLLFILAGYDDLITRNLLALVIPAGLLLACGFGARRAGHLGLLAAAVLCSLGIFASVGVAADRGLQRPDWRPLAQLLGPGPHRGQPGRAFLIQRYGFVLPLSLYLPGLQRIPPRRGVRVNQLDVIAFSAPEQPLCWWGAACNLIPTRLQPRYPIAGFHLVWRRRVRQFAVEHFAARQPVVLRSATVARALTYTHLRKDSLLVQR